PARRTPPAVRQDGCQVGPSLLSPHSTWLSTVILRVGSSYRRAFYCSNLNAIRGQRKRESPLLALRAGQMDAFAKGQPPICRDQSRKAATPANSVNTLRPTNSLPEVAKTYSQPASARPHGSGANQIRKGRGRSGCRRR